MNNSRVTSYCLLTTYSSNNKFIEEILNKVAKEFMVGRTEENVFTYVGLNIETTAKGIILNQIEYMKEMMEPATLRVGYNKRLFKAFLF